MLKSSSAITKKILGAIIVLSFFTTSCESNQQQTSAPQAVPVKWETVETGTVVDSSEFVGTLEASQRVSLAPQIAGRIIKVLANYGQPVTAGTPIIQLEPTRQQEQVNAQIAQVNVQRAALSQAEAELKSAEAQQASAAAQVEQQKAELEKTQANLRLAEVNLERTRFLVAQGVQSKQELDQDTRNYETSVADLNATQQTLNATIKSLQAAEAQVGQAKANINRQKSEIARAEAQVGATTQELEYNRVLAPIDGIVGNIPVKEGDFVNIGQQLTTITDNDNMSLNINIPIEFLNKLRTGIPVEIIKADGTVEVTGEVEFIEPTINQNTQAVLTKVFFKNNGNLKDQQFVRVRFIWNKEPGVLIPVNAVTNVGAQKFVYVATEEKTDSGNTTTVARQKPVVLGNIQGQDYQVISGINQGEKVVVSGILNLRDGTPIAEESLSSDNTP